jgi:thiaminase (transcriptional activator TenA)
VAQAEGKVDSCAEQIELQHLDSGGHVRESVLPAFARVRGHVDEIAVSADRRQIALALEVSTTSGSDCDRPTLLTADLTSGARHTWHLPYEHSSGAASPRSDYGGYFVAGLAWAPDHRRLALTYGQCCAPSPGVSRSQWPTHLRNVTRYARALAILAGRAPTSEDTLMFARHAAGALEVERTLHESLLPELDIEPGSLAGAEFAPTNLAYTSYLLAAVHGGSYAEGVAAVLPCYWIYWEVGKELVKHGSPDSRYQRWIDTYGGEQFGLVVQEVLNASDELANDLTGHERDRLFLRFGTTARYEWMFWDMGYREEWWPI